MGPMFFPITFSSLSSFIKKLFLSVYLGPSTVLVTGATEAKVTEYQATLADHGHARMPASTFL